MRWKRLLQNPNITALFSLLLLAFFLNQLFFLHFERVVVPEAVYVGKACNCQCILDARPWYVKINYWFWLFILSAPLLVFSTLPSTAQWKRALVCLAAVALGYFIAPFAVDLEHQIRNAPFMVYDDVPFQKTMDMVRCMSGSGTASRAFALAFGWVYATVYTGWWVIAWYAYHRYVTKHIDESFKLHWFCRLLVVVSGLAVLMILAWFFVPL